MTLWIIYLFLKLYYIYMKNAIFFFFKREFQLMASAPDNSSLLSDQDTNQFWCRRGLNPRSLIQPSEILPVELTRTHRIPFFGLGLKISM